MVDFRYKIAVPQRPTYLVARPRLIACVNQVVDQRLFVLAAPAGYGKTSLLVDWAAEAPLPVCWYSLGELDVDPWMFLSYMLESIRQRFPDSFAKTSALLRGRSRIPFSTASATFLRELAAVEQDFVLVLDDWHVVDEVGACADLVEQVLAHCTSCHVILAAREAPTIHNLMLLAARRQMVGLDERSLRFTVDELLPVLGDGPSGAPDAELAQRWIEQTNGWITGILLALEATGNEPPDEVAETLAEQRIYQFLAEQVLDRQPSEIKSFLFDAALLEEVEAQACDELRGTHDTALLLEKVRRAHLFVTEIGSGVVRFHPLFREFLLERYRTTAPDQFRAMARRIGEAHLARRQWSAAFDLFLKANDRAAAQRVVSDGGEATYLAGRLETLERWFEYLWLDDLDAALLCLRARVLLDRGDQVKAELMAKLAAVRASTDEQATVLLLQAQIARITGKYDTALTLAHSVARGGATPAQQAAALRTIAISHERLGQKARAVKELKQALDLENKRDDLYAGAQLHHDLGVCHEGLGLLHTAEEYNSRADAYWASTGNIGLRAMSLNSKGVVQHLSGRYLDAHRTLTAASAEARAASIPQYEATALASLGDLYSDLGLWEKARVAYRDARELGGTSYLMRYLDLAEATLMIRRRELSEAARILAGAAAGSSGGKSASALVLQSLVAAGQADYAGARNLIDEAIALLADEPSMELAKAYLVAADLTARTEPAEGGRLLAALDRAVGVADKFGHDGFLVGTALHMPVMMRRAAAAGWPRASDWMERQQETRVAARMIDQHDQRPVLTIRTLGTDQILVDGRAVALGWSKAREVLFYLLQHPDNTTPDMLRAALWPDLPADKGRTVKDAVYALRSALPSDLIALHGRQFYRLEPRAARVEYDVAAFEEQLGRAATDPDAVFAALDYYGGPFLPACDSPWCHSLRAHLERRYIQALHLAAEASEQTGSYSDALGLYRRVLDVAPFDETAHHGVMSCYLKLGNRAAAIAHYRAFRNGLHDELGLDLDSSSPIELLYTRILNSA